LNYRTENRPDIATAPGASEAIVQIHGEHLIRAAREHVWHLLNDPEAMTLTLQARGPGGGVAAVGRITLHEVETEAGTTRVAWSGEPQLMGLLATVGGRLVQGAAKTQADQFFTQLRSQATSTTSA
jgi:carbon monoxide dehydrogenase subunit G